MGRRACLSLIATKILSYFGYCCFTFDTVTKLQTISSPCPAAQSVAWGDNRWRGGEDAGGRGTLWVTRGGVVDSVP